MAKLLFAGTHGVEDPTKAGLVFLATKGGKEAGHDVAVALLGDGTILMDQTIRDSVLPVGIPPLKDLFQFVIDNKIPVYV